MRHGTRSRALAGWFALAGMFGMAATLTTQARAQEFPARPVTVIVANAAGGGSDISMRVVQAKAGELLGQPLVVDIRAGGNSLIGTRAVAVAPPDGYTLGITEPAFLVNQALMKDWHYDAVKDFTPVAMISVTPMILAVPAAMPVKNLQELVTYARANPGKLNYGSPGTGNAGHLAIEQMRNQFGLKMTHVPYKGAGPGTIALVAGEVNMMMAGSSFVPLVQEGRLRAMAVTGSQRLPSLPDVPTFAELGYPAINVQTFALIVAPASTPRAVVQRLNAAITATVQSPDIRAALLQRGQVPAPGSPEDAAAFVRDNQASLLKIVKDADIHLD